MKKQYTYNNPLNQINIPVKTLFLSKLPQKERNDIFKLLLDNKIQFSKDNNGNYTATIKVINNNPNKNIICTFQRNQISNNNQNAPTKCFKVSLPSSKRIQSYNELFSKIYSTFYNGVKPLIGVRGKTCKLYQLKYTIEEIYSIRFIQDSTYLKAQLLNKKEINLNFPFPLFVYKFLVNKYTKKAIIDQQALNVLITVEYFRQSHKDIDIFARLLSEEYDNDDLLFFLFIRSCIEKETGIPFLEKARDEINLQHMEERNFIDTKIYLNHNVCLNIANAIFGENEKVLVGSFMKKIEKNIEKTKNGINAVELLNITIRDYHKSKELSERMMKMSPQIEYNYYNQDKNISSSGKEYYIDLPHPGMYSNLKEQINIGIKKDNLLYNSNNNDMIVNPNSTSPKSEPLYKSGITSNNSNNINSFINSNITNNATTNNNLNYHPQIKSFNLLSFSKDISNSPHEHLLSQFRLSNDIQIKPEQQFKEIQEQPYYETNENLENIGEENSFYQTLISFYHQEQLQNNYCKEDVIQGIISTYLQEKELDMFFEKVFSFDNSNDEMNSKLNQFKLLIMKKVTFLLTALMNNNQSNWFSSLKLTQPYPQEAIKHFQKLNSLFLNILKCETIFQIPETSISDLCKNILNTNELMDQIIKVIEKNFN